MGDTAIDERARARNAVIERLAPLAWPDTRFVDALEHFIPGYDGCERLPEQLAAIPAWSGTGLVYATPDNCLEPLRSAAIGAGRPLLQTIAVRMGFRYFAPASVPPALVALAGTLDGAARLATPVGLREVAALGPLDAVVTGCRAVSRDGMRMGKGHGWFDIEWGILTALGIAGEDTPVIVACHDVQILRPDEVPPRKAHDTLVDWIVTPSQTIEVARDRPKPVGIAWDRLRADQLASIRPLHELRAIEDR